MRPSAGSCRLTGTSAKPKTRRRRECVERLQEYLESNFEPGPAVREPLRLPAAARSWFVKANARAHRMISARPVDRLAEEHEVMRPLPERAPDTDRRWVMRVAPDPYLRFDTNDYSLDPELAGRRVEVRVSQRQIAALALDLASSPAATSAASLSTARSLRSSTPGRSKNAAASARRSLSSSARCPSMTS